MVESRQGLVMLTYKLELLLFEHSDPIYLPITEEIALSLIGAWEMHEDADYRSLFEAAKEETHKQSKDVTFTYRFFRDRLFNETCIVVEWKE